MDLKKDYRKRLILEIIADEDQDYDEISPFVSAMEKIHQDSHKIGFKNRFTQNERIVLQGIWDKVKEHVQPAGQEIQKGDSGKAQSSSL